MHLNIQTSLHEKLIGRTCNIRQTNLSDHYNTREADWTLLVLNVNLWFAKWTIRTQHEICLIFFIDTDITIILQKEPSSSSFTGIVWPFFLCPIVHCYISHTDVFLYYFLCDWWRLSYLHIPKSSICIIEFLLQ